MNSRLLAEIIIPRFITKALVSKKCRAKYYKMGDKIPPTYLDKYIFDKKGFLVDKEGNRILANPRTAGEPRYEVLSGNKLLSGYGSHHMRNMLVNAMKDFYRPLVQEYIIKHGPITEFPVQVTWDVYTDISSTDWDASNLFFYYKYFEDSLHEKSEKTTYKGKPLLQLIPDDSIKYITWAASAKIIPVDNWDDRKFVFKFYYDERKELKRRPWIP